MINSESSAFPGYKNKALTPMGEELIINGFPARVYFFESTENPERIIDYYSFYFRKKGLKPIENSWEGIYMLSAIEGKKIDGVLILKDDQKDRYKVFLSSIDIGKNIQNKQPFNLKSGSIILMDIISKDRGKNTRTMIVTNTDSVRNNMKYYRNSFKNNSWSIESEEGDGIGSHLLIFKKSGKQCIVTIYYSPEMKLTTVLFLMEE